MMKCSAGVCDGEMRHLDPRPEAFQGLPDGEFWECVKCGNAVIQQTPEQAAMPVTPAPRDPASVTLQPEPEEPEKLEEEVLN